MIFITSCNFNADVASNYWMEVFGVNLNWKIFEQNREQNIFWIAAKQVTLFGEAATSKKTWDA